MSKHTIWLIRTVVLAALVYGVGFGIAAAAQSIPPVSLKLHNPTGAFEVTQTFAARLDTLNGKTVCEISDDTWEVARTFPLIADLLQKQFPTVKIVSFDQFPAGIFAIDSDKIGELAKAKGCQAAITGNAA